MDDGFKCVASLVHQLTSASQRAKHTDFFEFEQFANMWLLVQSKTRYGEMLIHSVVSDVVIFAAAATSSGADKRAS
ncbi:MAG: hypothetical protein AAB263_08895 [Planctomycetota bacterium]